jgi:hypothetical protein
MSRFHVELSKRLNGDVQSSMIAMLDLKGSLGVNSHDLLFVDSMQLAVCDSHLVLWLPADRLPHHSRKLPGDDGDIDDSGRIWLFPRRPLPAVLEEISASCSATYLSDNDSASSSSAVVLTLFDPRDIFAHQLSSLFHVWRLSAAAASALWSNIQARQLAATDSRRSISLLNEAYLLASIRRSCWQAMQTFASVASRCNKMVPRSVCDVKMWSWEEFAYLAWLGVPVSVLFPPGFARALVSVSCRYPDW